MLKERSIELRDKLGESEKQKRISRNSKLKRQDKRI